MSAVLIDGKKIAAEIKQEIKVETETLKRERGITPGLAFVIVGENPASQSYVRMKGKGCNEVGFYSVTEKLPEQTTEAELLRVVSRFNNDPKIHGILVQLPLPKHINESTIINAIDYRKDVDGFHPINLGRLVIGEPCFKPATPAGVRGEAVHDGTLEDTASDLR